MSSNKSTATAYLSADEFFKPENGVFTRLSPAKRITLLGEITTLLLASELHRSYAINDIGAVFLPPIHLNQFRIYRQQDGQPVGLVTWAWLTKQVEYKYVNEAYHLHPSDWKGGDQLWAIDFVAPFGHAKSIINDVRSRVFPDDVGKAVRIGKDGKPTGIMRLHGAKAFNRHEQVGVELTLPGSK